MSALVRLYEKSHTNRASITPLEAAILELDDAPEDYSKWVNGAANELEGLHNKVKSQADELATLRAQLAEAREALKYIADYGNYATEGEIETSDGVMHVSDYAGKKL